MVGLSSCKIFNPNLMFKTPKNYQYSTTSDTLSKQEYRISSNDMIELRLYANDGFRLIDMTNVSTGSVSGNMSNFINGYSLGYLVQLDGNVKLPILGWTKLKGYTVREAELMLEEKFTAYYNKPFIILKVINKRVLIFPGSGGAGKVLTLENNNTTLLEGLAHSGGITESGKAYKIKLIRRSAPTPEVYYIDLSTIKGLKDGNIILQANDIIYVEPKIRIAQGILNEIAPYLSLFTTAVLIYTLVNTRKN